MAVLAPRPPRLVAIGGLSGTGKSTLARRLAAELGRAPGARVLRSDVLRKLHFGFAPEEQLPPEAYAGDFTAQVYRELRRKAAAALPIAPTEYPMADSLTHFTRGFGLAPVFCREGGSIPVVSTFQEALGVPAVLFGVAFMAIGVGVDYAIGDPAWVGRGLGVRILWAWMARARQRFPEVTTYFAAPDHRNEASLRMLDKVGFSRGLWFDEPLADGTVGTMVGCTLDVRRVLG